MGLGVGMGRLNTMRTFEGVAIECFNDVANGPSRGRVMVRVMVMVKVNV